jgi:hypothetical protein
MILAELVDIRFRSRELQHLCNRHAALKSQWGGPAASAIAQTLHELDALERLGDLETLPYIRLQRDDEDGSVLIESAAGVRVRLTGNSSARESEKSWKACDSVVIVEVDIFKK